VSAEVRTFVALDSGVDRELVSASLPTQNGMRLVGVIDGLDETWPALQETPSDLLLIACTGYSERALLLIDGAVKQWPDRPVVVLCAGEPNGFTRRVFEAGADDLVTLPETPDRMSFILEKTLARRRGAERASGIATGELICILGPKGGTGKTLTACNLGVGLAAAGRSVAVLDLDLQFGDVALALGVAPEKTIYDLARSGGSLDAEKLDAYLMRHESGLRVLVAPARPDQASAVTADFLRDVYATLRSTFDFVIIDTPPGFTPEVIATVDAATRVIMVGMLDSLSLKNTKLGLETLELMGVDRDRITFLLNRGDSKVGISHVEAASIVGRAMDVVIPSDRDIPRSVNEGTPILQAKARSEAARGFSTLVSMYLNPDTGKKQRRGLFRRKGK
jgi:pilus assembly protein CpaE